MSLFQLTDLKQILILFLLASIQVNGGDAAASPPLTFHILNSLTLTRNLRAPWRWSE